MALTSSIATAQSELQRLTALSVTSSVILDNRNLVPYPNQPPVLIIQPSSVVPSEAADSSLFSLPSSSTAASTTNISPPIIPPVNNTITAPVVPSADHGSSKPTASVPSYTPNQDIPDAILTEDQTKELNRLENTIHDLTEINDRIMAQNIALLGDLEAAQRAVRELRGEKDALALQLRKALEQQQ